MKTTCTKDQKLALAKLVETTVFSSSVVDIHTHLYDPAFKGLLLWGIDDLLVYHYLVAEAFRYLDIPYQRFWSLSKAQQADIIWDQLFLQHSPVSEACRGVVTTLNLLGLDVKRRSLPLLRKWFADQAVERHLDRCMELARVSKIFMTNSPFDEVERPVWESGFTRDERFCACLRIDPLLVSWAQTASKLRQWGYDVRPHAPNQKTFDEVRRFLGDWTRRIQAHYLMVSLPPEFQYPGRDMTSELLDKAVLPHCLDHGLPFAVMLGVKRAVNPHLQLAGDGVGLADLEALEHLCRTYPDNRFLAAILARENQHQACVLARKFRNLHLFGCWWFTNIPCLIEEITLLRTDLLGLSFTAQHSDARVLDQIVYKWQHTRSVVARVLVEKYTGLAESGWQPSPAEVQRDVHDLFGGAFARFSDQSQGKPIVTSLDTQVLL